MTQIMQGTYKIKEHTVFINNYDAWAFFNAAGCYPVENDNEDSSLQGNNEFIVKAIEGVLEASKINHEIILHLEERIRELEEKLK